MFVIFKRLHGINNTHVVDKDLINLSLIARTRLAARGSDLKLGMFVNFHLT